MENDQFTEMSNLIYNLNEDIRILLDIANAVENLPFGGSQALPWCRDAFPKLDCAMIEWGENKEGAKNNLSKISFLIGTILGENFRLQNPDKIPIIKVHKN